MRINVKAMQEKGFRVEIESDPHDPNGTIIDIFPERSIDYDQVRRVMSKEFGLTGMWADVMMEQLHECQVLSALKGNNS